MKSRQARQQTALVIGGSRGIGRAVCEAIAGDYRKVVVVYRRDEAAAQETCRAVAAVGVKP